MEVKAHILLGVIHKLRNLKEGGEGGQQKIIKDYMGGGESQHLRKK